MAQYLPNPKGSLRVLKKLRQLRRHRKQYVKSYLFHRHFSLYKLQKTILLLSEFIVPEIEKTLSDNVT